MTFALNNVCLNDVHDLLMFPGCVLCVVFVVLFVVFCVFVVVCFFALLLLCEGLENFKRFHSFFFVRKYTNLTIERKCIKEMALCLSAALLTLQKYEPRFKFQIIKAVFYEKISFGFVELGKFLTKNPICSQ